MIAREWKCRVPPMHSTGFTAYLYETGIKDSSETQGISARRFFAVICRMELNSLSLHIGINLNQLRRLLVMIFPKRGYIQRIRSMSLILTFQCSIMRSSSSSSIRGLLRYQLIARRSKSVAALFGISKTTLFQPFKQHASIVQVSVPTLDIGH